MRANLILAISLISFAIILSGCTKEAERSFPRLLTLEATNISGEGATLNAMISNLKENGLSPNCGFIIYSGGPSSLKTMGVLEAEPDMKTGSFHARAETGMKDGDEYWYTAFVDDGTTTVIGNVLSFRSRGGKAASIIEMEPKKGNLSDTVLLRLSGTIGGLSGLTVLFDNKAALIVDFINDELRVIVPSNLSIKENSVSITTGGTTNVFATKFELIVPEITDFQPNEAFPGETITINGLNFDPIASRNVVKFNGVIATVVSSTSTQLKVIAPNLEGVDCQISVTIGTLVGVADGVIKIKNLPTPLITDFYPAEVYPGEIVTINGLYFDIDPVRNIVKINNTIAQIVTSTYNQIRVLAPDIQGASCQISITVGARVGVASGLLKILSWPVYWTRMNDHPGDRIYRMGSFVIGNYGYTGLGAKVYHNYNLKFWRYDYTGDSWQEVAPFPGVTRVSPVGFAAGGKGYIVGGSTLDNQSGQALRDFYEFNPGTNSWTRLSDYPGNIHNAFFGWAEVVNGKAYIALSTQDFYSYVPSTDQWTKLSNPPVQLYSSGTTFVAGDIIYVVGGFDISSYDKREVWAYNTVDGTWTRKSDFPGEPRRAAVGFGVDGKYYVGLGFRLLPVSTVYRDFWKYDPQDNLWSNTPDFAGAARSTSFCLVINNMAYIGAGYLSSNYLANDVYRFNPSPQK
jgi:N-acetylneuraminic acid mutarotase